MASPLPSLSVVIPVFNEEDNLRPLLEELASVLRPLGRPFEVLCVDDASTDRSFQVLSGLRASCPELRILRHRVNSGESAAQASGFACARGEIIVTMDADLQNDPHDIPAMLEALRPDVAAVAGVRRQRLDDTTRRLSSRIANGFRNRVTGDRIADAGCTFRVLRRSAVAELPVFNGLHRFIPTLLRRQGYQVVELLVNHRPRTRGQSKYGVGNRLWRGLRDCFGIRWFSARAVRGDRLLPENADSRKG
jgi:dolichol-phosphate mannosyltransferase